MHNEVLFVSLCAWFVAQTLKTLINMFKTKKFSAERSIGAGGFPSAHSASVCALAITTARVDGLSSSLFAIAFLFAAIVMYDAMGVRRSAGEHAKLLNKLYANYLFDVKVKNNDDDPSNDIVLDPTYVMEKKLKEFLGHTPFEVLSGALLGILISMLFV